MPIPLLAPIIAGGASLLGAGIDAFTTGRQNRRSMQFSREMYQRQYQDNLNFWRMQNDYNSPQAQMKRFQEAGLNPHLIYGQGNAGNAGSIQTPDIQAPQFRSPEVGGHIAGAGLNFINAIYDLDIKAAQVDNLKAQNTVITQDALLKAAQIGQTTASANRSIFDLDLAKELRSVSAEAAREALRQTRVTTDIAIRRDAREAISNSVSVQEAFSRLQTAVDQRAQMRIQRAQSVAEIRRIKADTSRIRQNIGLMQQEGVLKQLDIELRRAGINPQDPMWARILGRMMNRALEMFGDDDAR